MIFLVVMMMLANWGLIGFVHVLVTRNSGPRDYLSLSLQLFII